MTKINLSSYEIIVKDVTTNIVTKEFNLGKIDNNEIIPLLNFVLKLSNTINEENKINQKFKQNVIIRKTCI